MKTYEERREEERKEEREYRGDLIYEVWRRGGNPDRVDGDMADHYRDRGYSPDGAAASIMRQDRERREERAREDEEAEYYEGLRMEEARFAQEEEERRMREKEGPAETEQEKAKEEKV